MCARLSVLVIAAIVILTFAPAALAQLDEQSAPPDPCFDAGASWDGCYGAGGGNYTSCMAVGAWGQQCQAKVWRDEQKTIAECASVDRSASCQCNPRTFEVKGICTYQAR